jgi:hypothetical protein
LIIALSTRSKRLLTRFAGILILLDTIYYTFLRHTKKNHSRYENKPFHAKLELIANARGIQSTNGIRDEEAAIMRRGSKSEMSQQKAVAVFFWIIFLLIPMCADAYDEPAEEIVVQNRGTLINICQEYLEYPKKWREIAKINHIKNPDLIYPGQILRIPVSLLKGVPTYGVADFIKGRVEVQSEGSEEWRLLSLNDRVREGTKIRTASEGAVEIVFEDSNSFLQRSNTTVGIRTARKKGVHHALYRLFLEVGRAITKIKRVTGTESRFEIGTPSCIAAARGTIFRTSVDLGEAARSEVLQGAVDVEGMSQKVKVREGEGTLVRKGEPPLEPKKLLEPPVITNLMSIYRVTPLYFEFGRVAGAVSYRALFSKDNDFKDILKEQIIKSDDRFTIFQVDDGTYFLQVRSIDDLGLEGLPSDTAIIKVRINPLPPMIESPVKKTVYGKNLLIFRWLRVSDAVRYHVQIAEDKEFNKVIEDRNNISATEYKTAPLDSKTYYFRISSIAEDDYQGAWSDILNFTIASEATAPEESQGR